MVSRQEIQATCNDIVREFAPLQVILFGSYGYGTPTEDSDVDLLVVMAIPESDTRIITHRIQYTMPSASMPSSVLKNISRRGFKRRTFPLQGHTI